MAAWFYQLMGEEVGPVSLSQIRQAAVDRRIQPDSLVRREGSPVWISADRIRGLFDTQGMVITVNLDELADAHANSIARSKSPETGENNTQSAINIAVSRPEKIASPLPTTTNTSKAIPQHSQRGLEEIYRGKVFAIGLVASALLVVVFITTSMNMKSRHSASLNETPTFIDRASIAIPPKPQTQKDPVEELRAYAGRLVASAQGVASERRFMVRSRGLELPARFEVDGDFFVDVKKSDSLISPYVGEIRIKRRLIYDNLGGFKNFPDNWQEVVIECRYENEQWLSRVSWDSQ
jgi:hypothetical protein